MVSQPSLSKMRPRIAVVIAALMVAAIALLGAPPAMAAAAAAPYPIPVPADGSAASAPSDMPPTGAPSVLASCTPYVDGDYVHMSSTAPLAVSAHGWWYRGSCANQKTTVYVHLYEFYSDNTWHWKTSGSAYVWPGGGSQHATARWTCGVPPYGTAGWRSLIRIYSPGAGASAYTAAKNLACG